MTFASDLLRQDALIDGRWHATTARFAVTDPATGEVLANVARCGRAETRAAIDAAEAALPGWRATPAKSRAAILRRWYELLMARRADIATLLTREQGKPLAESQGEVAYAASFIEWFAEEARRIAGDVLEHPQADRRILVLKQPIGVCAAITPWNFPAAMIARKAGAALAAGCTMVVKPASQTPLTALAMAALAIDAGLPAGVFNVVPGPAGEVGTELAENPTVRKLSFTGSTEVGRILMAQCAPTLKKLSLELGGNAPFIVFDDADLDEAVEGAIAAKYRNSGQTCVCANRFYVQATIHDRFAARLAERAAQLKVGNGLEDGVEQGPLIDEAALAKVTRHVADATARGARLLTGGEHLGGTWYAPTVLSDVPPDALITREETFGPVSALVKFDTEEEAIALANASEFGLAAYFYGRDISRVFRVAEALEYGMVGINTGLFSNEVGPFGGVKQSGFGREGSRYGLTEYLELKYLCLAI
ncbi:NAD-dependent succinate-semialdehyde dehydrogenase [Chitiniphilus eburneus]|uniref:NAD-dependent succinate-semialdehyde dehydrogenase n=1 Tax=Chitiniphilus eburneus TaxID=2571148 RepID=A0A4U0QAD3_9NEIS|nr:NAD-dependent succinate-semialdehyde dehydrogenase [Chitiniphilus eburneus]TJZ77372.1 NAD-dependent succinate-semialdehyde dehydrogenase [Chitiniphilus eburneus]